MSDAETIAPQHGYWRVSERPLQSLFFILPLLVTYEAGVRLLSAGELTTPAAPHSHVVAFTLMQRFFVMLGATGAMLPALAVIGVLLAWHIARKDPWTLRPWVGVGMLFESVLLAIPLILVGSAVATHLPMWSLDHETKNLLLLSLGAGVYEEAVFRLGALTLISLLVCDVLGVPPKAGLTSAVLTSAVLFALYHYWGVESFTWRSMVFRTIAGVYFAILFLLRGFGVTVGAHAAYDILIVGLRHFAADAP